MNLSERQHKILEFIKEFYRETGYPPTIREIGSAVDISSTSVVNYNLNVLQEQGYIERDAEVSRGIKVVGEMPGDSSPNVVSLPLLGTIAAGEPAPVLEEDRPLGYETIELTRDIVKDEAGMYALQVKGDSMIDALINDGDLVVMQKQQEAHDGDMVAIWLKDEKETTLKRFYLEGDQVRLQPANPGMDPIYTQASNVDIQGKVVAVIRQLR